MRVTFDQVDSTEEICGLFNKVFENQAQMEAKIVQNAQEIEALKPKKKGKSKMKSKGSASMRVIAILMLIVALAGLGYAAYVPTDITYEIASNPEMLAQYLRDVTGTMISDSYLFTPTLPADAPPFADGRVWYDNTANTLMISLDGTSWTAIAVGVGNSLDAAYNIGHGITVDGTAVTLTVPDGENNSALSIIHQENTNYNDAFAITNAANDAAAVSIDIDGTAGYDIQGTGDTWEVSVAGVGDFAGLIYGASGLLYEGTPDAFETTITPADPGADIIWVLPDAGAMTVSFMSSTLATNMPAVANSVTGGTNQLIFEGAGVDAHEAIITATDPTTDTIWTLPVAAAGTYGLMSTTLATNALDIANSVTGGTSQLVFEGASENTEETIIQATDPTADIIWILPDGAAGSVTPMATTLTTNMPGYANSVTGASNQLIFEGSGVNAFESIITSANVTATHTWTLPDAVLTQTLAFMGSTLATNQVDVANSIWGGTNQLIFEGATIDTEETIITATDPTADIIWTLPDGGAGTVSFMSSSLATNFVDIANSVTGGTSQLIFEGSDVDTEETIIQATDPTADIIWILPDGGADSLAFMASTMTTNYPEVVNSVWFASNEIRFEGGTADAFESVIQSATITGGVVTWMLPDLAGVDTLAIMGSTLATNAPEIANSVTGASNSIIFEGTANTEEIILTAADAVTSDKTITLPNKTGQVMLSSAASVVTPAAGATLTVGLSNLYTLTPTDNEDSTITFSGAGTAGDVITLVVTANAAGDEILTFHATLVSSTGTLTIGTTAARYYVITFISDGSHWYEVSRTGEQT